MRLQQDGQGAVEPRDVRSGDPTCWGFSGLTEFTCRCSCAASRHINHVPSWYISIRGLLSCVDLSQRVGLEDENGNVSRNARSDGVPFPVTCSIKA
jgi:hypothetical protein